MYIFNLTNAIDAYPSYRIHQYYYIYIYINIYIGSVHNSNSVYHTIIIVESRVSYREISSLNDPCFLFEVVFKPDS